MTPSVTRTLMLMLLCVVAIVGALSRVPAAQQPAPPDVMSALLQEVHGLRVAMEQSAAIAPRVQLTLSRLNIEEQRIAQLSAQVDRARQELTSLGLSLTKMADTIDQEEKRLPTVADEQQRRQIEADIRGLKQELKGQTASEQAARTRENDAAQTLASEQGRWIELNARLDELERLMAPIR
jgi:chromosome segregation ATPase